MNVAFMFFVKERKLNQMTKEMEYSHPMHFFLETIGFDSALLFWVDVS